MKRRGLLVLFLLITLCGHSQTWSEWMRQKKTQIKYLVEQISALKVYGDHLQDGYRLAKSALHTIGEIRDREWMLHKDYFHSLNVVNPNIRRWTKVADVKRLQADIVRQTKAMVSMCQTQKGADTRRVAYVKQVCDGVLNRSLDVLDELLMVLTNGELQLTDNERMKQIESIRDQMQAISDVTQAFGKAVIGIIQGAQGEQREIELSRILNSIK